MTTNGTPKADRPTCQTCPFWHLYGTSKSIGECRRNPPVYNYNSDHCADYDGMFSNTRDDEWCGEHPDMPAWLAAPVPPKSISVAMALDTCKICGAINLEAKPFVNDACERCRTTKADPAPTSVGPEWRIVDAGPISDLIACCELVPEFCLDNPKGTPDAYAVLELAKAALANRHPWTGSPIIPPYPPNAVDTLIGAAQAVIDEVREYGYLNDDDTEYERLIDAVKTLTGEGPGLAFATLAGAANGQTTPPVPTPPEAIPPDVQGKILAARDALARGDNATAAYHWLYSIADPHFVNHDPWATLEQTAVRPANAPGRVTMPTVPTVQTTPSDIVQAARDALARWDNFMGDDEEIYPRGMNRVMEQLRAALVDETPATETETTPPKPDGPAEAVPVPEPETALAIPDLPPGDRVSVDRAALAMLLDRLPVAFARLCASKMNASAALIVNAASTLDPLAMPKPTPTPETAGGDRSAIVSVHRTALDDLIQTATGAREALDRVARDLNAAYAPFATDRAVGYAPTPPTPAQRGRLAYNVDKAAFDELKAAASDVLEMAGQPHWGGKRQRLAEALARI